MPKYETTTDFWFHNRTVQAGETVEMSVEDAKYRLHHLSEVKAEAKTVAADLDEAPARDEKRRAKSKPDIEDVKATEDGDA